HTRIGTWFFSRMQERANRRRRETGVRRFAWMVNWPGGPGRVPFAARAADGRGTPAPTARVLGHSILNDGRAASEQPLMAGRRTRPPEPRARWLAGGWMVVARRPARALDCR